MLLFLAKGLPIKSKSISPDSTCLSSGLASGKSREIALNHFLKC